MVGVYRIIQLYGSIASILCRRRQMEQIEENIRVYEENGCTFTVKRKFESGGTSILEQLLCMLLDMMEREEQLTDKTLT